MFNYNDINNNDNNDDNNNNNINVYLGDEALCVSKML